MTFEIISTGSRDGNAVLLNDCILIDCGVPMKKLQEVKRKIRLVLLTHIHSDHFNPSTIRALHRERPTLRFACCPWLVQPLVEAGVDRRNIDVVILDNWISYNGFAMIKAQATVHDAPNCCWHICMGRETAFYATDTGTLDGIEAKEYDLYLVEANHTQAEIAARLAAKEQAGEYAYERRAAANHLSKEQTMDWLAENMGPLSEYALLHQHVDREEK